MNYPRNYLRESQAPGSEERRATDNPLESLGYSAQEPIAQEQALSGEPVQARTPDEAAGPRAGAERSTSALSGLSLDALVNGLRSCYPHPTNRGAARVTPNPLSVEQWLAEHLRKGALDAADYAKVLDAAKREARIAESNPESFRKTLRTWIREACWNDTIEENKEDALPPPSAGPRFTPDGWATGQQENK